MYSTQILDIPLCLCVDALIYEYDSPELTSTAYVFVWNKSVYMRICVKVYM